MKLFLSSNINTISSSILWSCLDDDVDDAILLKHFNNSLDQNENSMEALSSFTLRASRIYWLRSNVIRSLQNNIIQMNSSTNSACYRSISLCGISRVFGMTVSLSNLMNVKNKVNECPDDGFAYPFMSQQHFSNTFYLILNRVDNTKPIVRVSGLSFCYTTNFSQLCSHLQQKMHP